MGLMLGEFIDDYTVNVIDVFAMPQSGTVRFLLRIFFGLFTSDVEGRFGGGGRSGFSSENARYAEANGPTGNGRRLVSFASVGRKKKCKYTSFILTKKRLEALAVGCRAST